MVSDDPAAACAACMLLGQGAYGLHDENGESCAPLTLFGGDPDESTRAICGITLAEAIDTRLPAIRDAMASVLIGSRKARTECETALKRMPESERQGFLDERHDARRSSLNDIGKRALQYTQKMTAKLEAPCETQETVEAADG